MRSNSEIVVEFGKEERSSVDELFEVVLDLGKWQSSSSGSWSWVVVDMLAVYLVVDSRFIGFDPVCACVSCSCYCPVDVQCL